VRLVLALLALALAAPAASAGILAPEDATEAANALADAQEEQDVCYGWLISNDFDSSPDIGSSTGGPGVVVDLAVCPRYVMLTGSIHYACGSCEDSDAGRVGIETNLVPPPATKDLENLGLNADDLTGDNDDVTLMNMIEALPLLAAQSGAAPALVAETPTAVPATDVATNKPGSDFMREAWLKLLIFIALLSAGPLIFFYKRAQAPTPKET
jgi:hypothetical protein